MKFDEKYKQMLVQLGQNIIMLREEKGITQKVLAEKTGIRAEYLEKIETGNAYRVKLINHLSKIAKVLGVKLHVLFKNL